eukprot:symbB.v1.2.010973.t1/scaffold727.1/size198231/18
MSHRSSRGLRRPWRVAGEALLALVLGSGFWTFAQVAVPPTREAEVKRLAAKETLLEGIKSLDRGFSATEEQRSRVSEQIEELARWNPSTDPAKKLGWETRLVQASVLRSALIEAPLKFLRFARACWENLFPSLPSRKSTSEGLPPRKTYGSRGHDLICVIYCL